ncbi:MAG TPA: helix-turn-helix domain-containing GNAT family N-acetyltransferase [Terracidiphilus sp.]|nr:helix-turn-helix domain-containing GNAT family N-acetyltransferase [Terracidiphilus sp.]
MPIGASDKPHFAEQVSAVRQFNRFYTARLGLLRRRHLDGEFALTEARILYEIGASPGMTASALRQIVELDAGYISRLLSALTRKKLVRQSVSAADARERLLTLTATGVKAVAHLDQQSTTQIEKMLTHLTGADREAMVTALARVRAILAEPSKPPVRIERLRSSSSEALATLREYYEAVHVVQRDTPASIQKMLKAPDSGMWMAFLGDEVVGCVVLRKLDSIPHAAECKRLYVRPAARGNRIADALLDAMEAFARTQHVQWIYLDTYDDLKTAIALYEKRGYQRCERYNDNPQATLFMRKRLG